MPEKSEGILKEYIFCIYLWNLGQKIKNRIGSDSESQIKNMKIFLSFYLYKSFFDKGFYRFKPLLLDLGILKISGTVSFFSCTISSPPCSHLNRISISYYCKWVTMDPRIWYFWYQWLFYFHPSVTLLSEWFKLPRWALNCSNLD